MLLTDVLTLERVRVPLQATDKPSVITEMVDLLHATGGLTDRDAALNAVFAREKDRTTGIGYGLAIPHGKTTGAKQLVMAAGKPASPLEYQSLDNRPVTFIVMLVSPPDKPAEHMQALAKIARLMNIEEFRSKIRLASTPEALYAAIREHDTP